MCAALPSLPSFLGTLGTEGCRAARGCLEQQPRRLATMQIPPSVNHFAINPAQPTELSHVAVAALQELPSSRDSSQGPSFLKAGRFLATTDPQKVINSVLTFEMLAKWCKGLAVHINSFGQKPLAESETRAGSSCSLRRSLEGEGVLPEPHGSMESLLGSFSWPCPSGSK